MPNWAEIQREMVASTADASGAPDYDAVRRRYLAQMHRLTRRATILYYGNWLGGSGAGNRAAISLDDIHGFMTAVSGLDGRDLARSHGVVVDDLEDDQAVQDAVLSIHHTLMHMFDALPMAKLIENHLGDSFVRLQN